MHPDRFDALIRHLGARRLTRRNALFATAGFALTAQGTSAQGTPVSIDAVAANDSTLFVQTAAGGTFLPNTQATPDTTSHGTHVLTLSGHPGQTIGFSDRPARTFGQIGTDTFLNQLGFRPDNPPNAAIVASTPDGSDDVLVVELLNPFYDDSADLLMYEANILAEYTGQELAPVAGKQQDAELASEFGHVSLFIDDCPDYDECIVHTPVERNVGQIPGGPIGMCWSWDYLACLPCDTSLTIDTLSRRCNEAYPDDCHGECQAN